MTDLVSTGEAARLLGISPQRVIQLTESGQLKVIVRSSLGRLLHQEDVRRLAAERAKRKPARRQRMQVA